MTQTQPPKLRVPWWWLLLTVVLIAWTLRSFIPAGQSEVTLPYSAFLDQVRAGNVSSVQISGDQIGGQLAKAIPWPEPTPGATPTPATSPSPAAATYTAFTTTFPQAVGDAALLPLLESMRVEVNVEPAATPWTALLLSYGLPILLLVAMMAWMGRRAAQSPVGIFGFGRSRPRFHAGGRSDVTFADVADADEARGDLQEIVDFLRHPQKYHELGARIPRGVLLVGPPGTGKTLLARLQVLLARRVAEEIAVGEITTGAESDLIQATRLARRMVTRWGMGGLGLAAFQADEQQPFLGYELAQVRDYSEDTAARIDRDVQRLLDESHEAARAQLIGARESLDRLVDVLLREETVDQDGLVRILGPRPAARDAA